MGAALLSLWDTALVSAYPKPTDQSWPRNQYHQAESQSEQIWPRGHYDQREGRGQFRGQGRSYHSPSELNQCSNH